MEQKLASLLRVLSSSETQIDLARASLTKSSREAFKLIDTCGRNILSSFEISQFLEKHKVKLEQDEIRMVVQYYDISRKGKLDPEAFQRALTPRNKQSAETAKPSSPKDLEKDLVEFFNRELDLIRKTHTLRVQVVQAAQAVKTDLFKAIDKKAKGELTVEDIDAFLQKQGVRLSSSETKAILQRADRNRNCLITSEEFESFIVPDVTNKKVLAKQPELSPQASAPAYPTHYNIQTPKAVPNAVSDTPLTVSQVVDKYIQPKHNDYKAPMTASASAANFRQGNPSLQSTQGSYMPNYSSNYTPSQKAAPVAFNNGHAPYYPGMYSSATSPTAYQSNPNPSTDYRSDYRPTTSIDTNPKLYSSNHDLRLSQYPLSYSTHVPGDDTSYPGHPQRQMNKSLSTASFGPTNRPSVHDRGYNPPTHNRGYYKGYDRDYDRGYDKGYNLSPRSNYHRDPRDMWGPSSAYHSPVRHYEGSPHRSRGYEDLKDLREFRSVSPRYDSRYGPQTRDDLYRSQYPARYGRTEGLDGYGPVSRPYELVGRPHERQNGYGPYPASDHLRFTSDMLNREYNGEGIKNWGAVEPYEPRMMRVSRSGVGLYDRDQLRSKYNNLTRRGIYA